MEHRLYKYNRQKGGYYTPCAKCACGADLVGAEEIKEHLLVIAKALGVKAERQ